MKKMTGFLLVLFILSFQFVQTDSYANAQTLDNVHIYTAKENDSFYKIAVKNGVPEQMLKKTNLKSNDQLEEGEKIIVPKGLSKSEKDLLGRLINAEAKGEPYAGKLAVGAVVLNRVKSEKFPDSVKEVIYEDSQFESVDNGMIEEPAGKDSVKAVNEAIAQQGQAGDSLYFFNPDQTDSRWLRDQTVTTVIGNHQFAK